MGPTGAQGKTGPTGASPRTTDIFIIQDTQPNKECVWIKSTTLE
jgi:hypothetical protein